MYNLITEIELVFFIHELQCCVFTVPLARTLFRGFKVLTKGAAVVLGCCKLTWNHHLFIFFNPRLLIPCLQQTFLNHSHSRESPCYTEHEWGLSTNEWWQCDSEPAWTIPEPVGNWHVNVQPLLIPLPIITPVFILHSSKCLLRKVTADNEASVEL